MTRDRMKKMKEALNELIQEVQAKEKTNMSDLKPKMVKILSVIHNGC